jgi:hypothetical protein
MQQSTFSFGPFSSASVLAMADVARDYHPMRTMPREASRKGTPGLSLHPLWISGLVHMGIRNTLGDFFIRELVVEHAAEAFQSDVLTIILEWENCSGEVLVTFEVRKKRKLIAHGKAKGNYSVTTG